MIKADLSDTQSKEVLELDKKKKKKAEVLKKRIYRICFIITALLASIVCFISGYKYFSSITQTVIDRTDVHVSEIPFPAVTLCPLVKVSSLINGFKESDKLQISEFLHNLEEVIPKDDDSIDFNDQGRTALGYIDYDNILNKTSLECEDFFAECIWRRKKRNCCSLFHKMPYKEKICFAFNSLAAEDPEPTWPWSETFSGRKSGLRVTMKTNATEAMLPKVGAMINYPEERCSINKFYLQGEVHITLDALKFHADRSITTLHPIQRRCYFSDEMIKLRKTASLCWSDCRVAYLERVCNCTPRNILPLGKLQTGSCNLKHLPCIFEHKNIFLSNGNIYEKHTNEDTIEFMDCKCFQNCNSIQYKAFIRYDTNTGNVIKNNSVIKLEVYFLRDTMFSYRTTMSYSFLDFTVANCSIIALFLGVSFIDLIKCIQDYFEKRNNARTLAKAQQNK